MYISGTGQPVGHLDALPLLVDAILRSSDAILISEGGEERAFLDQAATSLATRRCRVLWAAEVLPDSAGMPSPQRSEPAQAGIPNDEFLIQSYKALTLLDQTCDRIVLLVSDAHALQQSTLRYIEFMVRSSPHLQVVFCGTRKFLDLLDADGFAWLRAQLMAGMVVTLATPSMQVPVASPPVTFVPRASAAPAREAVAPQPGLRRPRFMTGMSSQTFRLATSAVVGLGGAAWLTLCIQNGARTGPAAGGQAPVQSIHPKPLAAIVPEPQAHDDATTQAAAVPAAPEAAPAPPSSLPLMPPSAAVSEPSAPAAPQGGSQTVNSDPAKLPSSGPSSSPGAVGASASPSGAKDAGAREAAVPPAAPEPTASAAPARQEVNAPAPPPAPAEGLAATGPHPAATTHVEPGADPEPSPGVDVATSSFTAAPDALVMAMPPARAYAPRPGQNGLRRPEPTTALDVARHAVPAVPVRTAAAPGSRIREPRSAGLPATPPPADDQWLALQLPSGSGDGSQHYIGSYTTDANGVRMFHSEH